MTSVTETDVVVVGGGATGCGVARDLAMRGVDVTLVEKGGLGSGTTGRSHGLLHSGARYAVGDPAGARECIEENRILRAVAGRCAAPTGGYVVQCDDDPEDFFDACFDACRAAGIETDLLAADALGTDVPGLAAAAQRAFAVPDAVVFPSRLVAATAASARDHGARFLTNAPVTAIDTQGRSRVELAVGHPTVKRIEARHVVNAAGPWAGRVAALAGVEVTMRPTRGVMVVAECEGVGRVLNRARPPSDGDIVVPHDGRVVLGTTSVPVADPDETTCPESEVRHLLREARTMLPALTLDRVVSTYAGVRPLYADDTEESGRGISRGFHLLDHEARDGVPGISTVVGGKLTTHRLMAEAVTDHVCGRLGVTEPCRTVEEPLVGHDDRETLDGLVEEFCVEGPADADGVRQA